MVKLDIGCGPNKNAGYIGIDAMEFPGVDVVMNVVEKRVLIDQDGHKSEEYVRWPYDDGSVEHIHTSHFVEHLTREEWVPFFNEAYRVLKDGGTMYVVTPHFTHACAYGDPTHKSFLSEWVANYLNKAWRTANAPHTGYTCDFDFTTACSFDPWLATKHSDVQLFAVQRYTNSMRDLIMNLVKRPATP